MAEALADTPWWLDAWLVGMVTLATCGQYVTLTLDGRSVSRWMLAVGWTMLMAWFMFDWWSSGEIAISVIGAAATMLISGGTALLAWERIAREMEPKVWCLREPSVQCARRDRIEAEIARLKEKRHG